MVALEESRSRRVALRGSGKRLLCRCPRDPVTNRVEQVDPQCGWRHREILYDGPANCGKTFYDCYSCFVIATRYPDSRILWLRETLKSLRESIQEIFEDHVLGPGHPAIMQGGSREHRISYTFPSDTNRPKILDGGHIALGGLDRPDLYHSSQWDIILPFEATNPRVREYDYTKIVGRGLRGKGIPHPHCRYPDGIITDDAVGARFKGRKVREVVQEYGDEVFPGVLDPDGHPLFFNQARLECNPSDTEGESHWLWKRFEAGRIVRLAARHTDNPTITETDLKALQELPEPLRSVFYEGRWIATSGRVWQTYDPKVHLVRGEFSFDKISGGRSVRVYDWLDDNGNPRTFRVVSVVAGFDWGLTSPSSLQVFAKTAEGLAFRVAEIYRVQGMEDGKPVGTVAWFADEVVKLTDSHGLEAVLCDPSAAASWELFNVYLAKVGKGGLARPADNTRKTKDGIQGGLDLVRSMFGRNRLFLFTDCHIGPIDPSLRKVRRPVGWETELPHYVLARDPKDQTKILDYPDDSCVDHACDAGRLALMDVFQNERQVKPKPLLTARSDPWIHPTRADLEAERAVEVRRASRPTGLRQLRRR